MLLSHIGLALLWAVSVGAATTGRALVPQVRNAPGVSTSDTLRALRRALSLAERDTVFKNSTSLNKSWDGAVLFSYETEAESGDASAQASVSITCTTCYIQGQATAQLTIDSDFDVSEAFGNFTDDVEQGIDNVTNAVVDYVEDYVKNVTTNLSDGFDLDDFDLPPIDVDFDVDIPDIPECQLQFQFDGMELYVLLDTVLSAGATYTLNLYTSDTPIGFAVSNNLEVGVILDIDLILSVDGQIDISSGFHIKLDDGLAIDIPMFAENVSSIDFNGGNFEFLPVTIESAGVVLKAVLRVGLHAGFEVSTVGILSAKASGGVEVGVWAHVAEFSTNVTAAPAGDENGCELRVVESYQLALGAKAGASVALGTRTWGPVPETEIPIFYTTLADACATSGKSSPTTTPAAVSARDDDGDLTTTTISTEVVYKGVACISEGLINCPASLQTTTKATSTKTLITSVASGVDATFPSSITNAVLKTVPFGKNALALTRTSGSPVSYIPPKSTGSNGNGGSGGASDIINGETGGVSNKLIIGLSVGLGVPVLAALITGVILCCKRRKYAPVPRETTVYAGPDLRAAEPYTPGSYMSDKKGMNTVVSERR